MPLTSTYVFRGAIPGRSRPLCVRGHRAWSTDGDGKTHGRAGGSGYADRPPGFVPLTWHFRCLRTVVVSLVTGFGLGLGVLGAEGVGDPLVRGASLPVDAVRVDLQQDRDAQTEALIRESGVPALIFRNALSLDTPPVSLGGPAVFTADHPGREVTDAAPDPARLLQHRVGHLERHLPRQLAQVTRREPPAGRRRRVRRGAEPGGGRRHRPRPRGRYAAHRRQPPHRQARHAHRQRTRRARPDG